MMNWEQIQGSWTQYRGNVRENWGRITDADLNMIAGDREELIARVEELYGCDRDEAERQVREFEQTLTNGAPEQRERRTTKGRAATATR